MCVCVCVKIEHSCSIILFYWKLTVKYWALVSVTELKPESDCQIWRKWFAFLFIIIIIIIYSVQSVIQWL